MSTNVVHVTPKAHDTIKSFCQKHGVGMKDLVSKLVIRYCTDCEAGIAMPLDVAPVIQKGKFEDPPIPKDADILMSRPPFWERGD